MDELEKINLRILQLESHNIAGKTFQDIFEVTTELSSLRKQKTLLEHSLRIKNKVESGNAIDKSIVDREATKELNHKEAHNTAVKAKAIEHKIVDKLHNVYLPYMNQFTTVICDITYNKLQLSTLDKYYSAKSHTYIICKYEDIKLIKKSLGIVQQDDYELYIHTFKYSSKKYKPQIGYKVHYECIVYLNLGNKPVNHLLPNVIESTYEKDSRNLGFYTNLLLRSVQADDTILGINITNGNLIKAAQAMLCSTVIIPADNIAMRECEKTIKELQFK